MISSLSETLVSPKQVKIHPRKRQQSRATNFRKLPSRRVEHIGDEKPMYLPLVRFPLIILAFGNGIRWERLHNLYATYGPECFRSEHRCYRHNLSDNRTPKGCIDHTNGGAWHHRHHQIY